jgi:hypothetical protein
MMVSLQLDEIEICLSPSVNSANGTDTEQSPLDFGFEADQVDGPLDLGFEAEPADSPLDFGFEPDRVDSPLDMGFPAESPLDFGFPEATDGPVHSPLDLGFNAEPMPGFEEAVMHSPLDLGFPTDPVDSRMDFGFGLEPQSVHSPGQSVHGLPTGQQCKLVFIRFGPC